MLIMFMDVKAPGWFAIQLHCVKTEFQFMSAVLIQLNAQILHIHIYPFIVIIYFCGTIVG
jgi:hypothetical protein